MNRIHKTIMFQRRMSTEYDDFPFVNSITAVYQYCRLSGDKYIQAV